MSRRLFLTLVSLAAVFLAPLPAFAEVRGIKLELDNSGDRALRCVVVIAHFMSEDLEVVAPGVKVVVALEGDSTDGSLFLRSADGRRKPIENILCGALDDWSSTRGEVPLLPLRSSSTSEVHLTCHVEGRLRCVAAHREN